MRQRRKPFGQDPTVALDIGGAHLEQIVEAAGDHVAGFDLGNRLHRAVERGERGLAGVGQPDLDKGDMGEPELDRVEQRAIAGDDALCLQPLQPRLGRGLRQADAAGKLGDRHPAIARQQVQNRPVERVQIAAVRGHRGRLS